MNLIVAVYADWGIGCDGTQPIALSADRKFFRETTRGAAVIVGRRTVEDFPGGKPLPGRENIVLSRTVDAMPGFTVCATPAQAVKIAEKSDNAFVIGGGSVYKQMLPVCNRAYVTKLHCTVPCDTYFPNLDNDPTWELTEILQTGEENGIAYQMCLYTRK